MNNSWQQTSLFQGITKQELAQFGNFFVEKKYKQTDYIFHHKQINDKLIVIISGQATLEASLENHNQDIAIFRANDFVGGLCLLGKPVYFQHSLRVTSDELIAYELSNKNWFTIVKKNPQLKEKILANLTTTLYQRLEHADNKLVALFAISRYLTSTHNMGEVGAYILKTILEIIPSEQALLCSYSHTTEKLHIYETSNYPTVKKNNFYPIKNFPLLLDILKSPRTMIFRSQDLPHGQVLWPLSKKQSIITPIITGHKTIGFICLSGKANKEEYSANNIILLEALANQLAAFMQNLHSQEWAEAASSLKREYIDLPY